MDQLHQTLYKTIWCDIYDLKILKAETISESDLFYSDSWISGTAFLGCTSKYCPASLFTIWRRRNKRKYMYFQIPIDNYLQSVKTRFVHSYLTPISIRQLRGTHTNHLLNCLINLHLSLRKLLRNNLPAFPGGSLYARVVAAWMESCSIHWSHIPRGGV